MDDSSTLSRPARLLSEYGVGETIGTSPWLPIEQAMISEFGRVTLDPDPMHVDPAWARAHGPFDSTIAFGFQTMSLLSYLLHQASQVGFPEDPMGMGYFLNYGFDRLRLIEPVRVGSRVRGAFGIKDKRTDAKGRENIVFDAQVEIEGCNRPALVADWIALWIPAGAR